MNLLSVLVTMKPVIIVLASFDEALCHHLCLEHLVQIRAALQLVQDIKGSRSWLGDGMVMEHITA